MSTGHRLSYAAAVRLIGAIALFAPISALSQEGQQPVQPNGPETSSDIIGRAADEKTQQEYAAEEYAVPVRLVEKSEDAERTERREDESDQREKADLIAQQIGAAAATKGAELAWWQTWIAFGATIVAAVGTALVWRTLKEAKETTRLALEGSKSARDAVCEARKANRIAADSAKKQLRAYVMITNVKVHRYDGNNGYHVEVFIKNLGATPADKVSHCFIICTIADDFTPDLVNSFCLGPGQEQVVDVSSGGGANNFIWSFNKIKNKDIFLVGTIRYKDCFGVEERQTNIKCLLREKEFISSDGNAIKEIIASIAEDGNNYT